MYNYVYSNFMQEAMIFISEVSEDSNLQKYSSSDSLIRLAVNTLDSNI